MLNISPSIFWPISALLQIRPFVKLDQKIPLPCKESRNLHLCILLLLHSWQISQVDTVVPNLPEQHRKYFIQREAQRIRAEKVRNCSLNFSIIETLYPMHHSVCEVR